jgi:oligopeptide transport system permease protein
MKHALQRAFLAMALLLCVSLLAFGLIRVAPGGPFDRERAPVSAELEAALQDRYRLNEPLPKQYLRYVGLLWEWYPHDGWLHVQTGLFQGDPGPSLTAHGDEVRRRVIESFRVSVTLGVLALCIAVGWGIPWGVMITVASRRRIEAAGCLVALLIVWMPLFVLGPILIMTLVHPHDGAMNGPWPGRWNGLIPVLILGLFLGGGVMRRLRDGLRTALESPCIMAARARGLSEASVLWRHAFPLALVRVTSDSGPLLAMMLTGALVVENVFRVPGLGMVMVEHAGNRDLPMVVNVVLVYALLLLVLSWAANWLHWVLDPRGRHA